MKTPRVSIIIPAYHSQGTLRICLQGLRAQWFTDFEVIIVNSSTDTDTAEIVNRELPAALFIQSPVRLLPHAARNRGVREARGSVLVFTDPDCRAAPDWLARLMAGMAQGADAVAGGMDLDRPDWRSTGIHLAKFWWALPGGPEPRRSPLPTANAAYSRAAWDRCGPFEGDIFAGDARLAWRLHAAGLPCLCDYQTRVYHRHDEPLWQAIISRWQRGQEFARCRMTCENWSSSRRLLTALAAPLLLGWVLLASARAAFRAGWGARFLWTTPAQLLLQGAWIAGETRVYGIQARQDCALPETAGQEFCR